MRFEEDHTEMRVRLQEVGLTHRLTGEMASRLRFGIEPSPDWAKDEMLLTLSTKVWTEDLPPEHFEATRTITATAPADWWQHFKETYAGTWWLRWLVRRRPVMSTARRTDVTLSVDLRRFRAYPAAPEMTGGFGPAVLRHEIDHQITWRDA